MARMFYYLVDRLTHEKAAMLSKSLNVLRDVKSVSVSAARGMVEVQATRDVEEQVRMACEMAGAAFRTRARL